MKKIRCVLICVFMCCVITACSHGEEIPNTGPNLTQEKTYNCKELTFWEDDISHYSAIKPIHNSNKFTLLFETLDFEKGKFSYESYEYENDKWINSFLQNKKNETLQFDSEFNGGVFYSSESKEFLGVSTGHDKSINKENTDNFEYVISIIDSNGGVSTHKIGGLEDVATATLKVLDLLNDRSLLMYDIERGTLLQYDVEKDCIQKKWEEMFARDVSVFENNILMLGAKSETEVTLIDNTGKIERAIFLDIKDVKKIYTLNEDFFLLSKDGIYQGSIGNLDGKAAKIYDNQSLTMDLENIYDFQVIRGDNEDYIFYISWLDEKGKRFVINEIKG